MKLGLRKAVEIRVATLTSLHVETEVASAVAGTAGCTLREAASNLLRKHLALRVVLWLDRKDLRN